jgi:CO/xanthine dehydrogenase Mo-binding subunit
MDRALEVSDYHSKRKKFAKQNLSGPSRSGVGIAAFLHGAGFTGSGERYLSSVVGVEGCADGNVRVLVSSTEFGQGTKTVLSQIAAEALGLPYESVSMAQPDTLEVPNSGPTVASRTVMVVGKLVQSAALGIAQTLMSSGLLHEGYSMAKSVPGRVTRLPAAFSGMIKRIEARLTQHLPGRFTLPKSPWIWRRTTYR